jgi:hypothetical protein
MQPNVRDMKNHFVDLAVNEVVGKQDILMNTSCNFIRCALKKQYLLNSNFNPNYRNCFSVIEYAIATKLFFTFWKLFLQFNFVLGEGHNLKKVFL